MLLKNDFSVLKQTWIKQKTATEQIRTLQIAAMMIWWQLS